jgi:hypothetical protein
MEIFSSAGRTNAICDKDIPRSYGKPMINVRSCTEDGVKNMKSATGTIGQRFSRNSTSWTGRPGTSANSHEGGALTVESLERDPRSSR